MGRKKPHNSYYVVNRAMRTKIRLYLYDFKLYTTLYKKSRGIPQKSSMRRLVKSNRGIGVFSLPS